MKNAGRKGPNRKKSGPSQRDVDEAIAAIMANTRRRGRQLNALEVAQKIEFASQALGSLQSVAERTVLSYEMIRQIHSSLKCTAKVRELVRIGRLSSFDVLHRLSKLSPKDQDAVGRAVVRGAIDSDDVRGLVTLRKEMLGVPMPRLIDRIRSSKNIKHYIAYFSLPKGALDAAGLRRRFDEAIGRPGIVSLRLRGCLGTLTMNAEGRKRLEEKARKSATTKRRLIDHIVAKGKRRNG